uniref:Zinc finger protein 653 n=1 Tax=Amphilophus citrinellus TaxID=61819 RepID=A0A3Q0S2T0_AMPCI
RAQNALIPLAEVEGPLDANQAGEHGKGVLRRCRGRPRLTDSDRAQRRLESRKKYDVRRVYLGESHKLWSELRRRTSLSDAGLAEYLILLNSTYGEKYQQKYCGKQRVSSLQSLVCWYQEHSRSCPHEPQLRALESQSNFSTSAIWQCEANHSFVQYLFSPLGEASDSEHEEGVNGDSSLTGAFHSVPADQGEETEDLREGKDGGEGEDEVRTVRHDYECVMTASLADELDKSDEDLVLSQSLSGSLRLGAQPELSVPPPMEAQEQSELFEPQTLQTVVTSCEIPDQRTALEGSQLIIITGPSYEALASEGIQLNMGGGNVEEVTCTVIGGVTYNQVCTSDSKIRTAEDEDSMTGANHVCILNDIGFMQKSLPLLKKKNKKNQNLAVLIWLITVHCVCFCSVRSKRSRRGPVIEADGMLKMFHCPYEGCSQVYVAISSFQNHVNLVHRKGRTKVCPHPGCGKKFYLSNHLHRHMIIHSGVRDFICETCGKSFKRKNHLEVHRRTHTGETPLQCEICGYQCRQRASLNWHMKKHTPEAHYNFTCEFCDKRFEKLDSVKFHKLKSHPDKQAT